MKPNFRYVSEYKSKYSQSIAETIEYILDHDYGATIRFEDCAKILHYNIEDENEKRKFKGAMRRVRNFLIDRGYVLKAITGVGYYILKPKQISGYCYHTYIRKTEDLVNKSERILNHIDKSGLSSIRGKEYLEFRRLNLTIGEEMERMIFESEYFRNKNYYDSLED